MLLAPKLLNKFIFNKEFSVNAEGEILRPEANLAATRRAQPPSRLRSLLCVWSLIPTQEGWLSRADLVGETANSIKTGVFGLHGRIIDLPPEVFTLTGIIGVPVGAFLLRHWCLRVGIKAEYCSQSISKEF